MLLGLGRAVGRGCLSSAILIPIRGQAMAQRKHQSLLVSLTSKNSKSRGLGLLGDPSNIFLRSEHIHFPINYLH